MEKSNNFLQVTPLEADEVVDIEDSDSVAVDGERIQENIAKEMSGDENMEEESNEEESSDQGSDEEENDQVEAELLYEERVGHKKIIKKIAVAKAMDYENEDNVEDLKVEDEEDECSFGEIADEERTEDSEDQAEGQRNELNKNRENVSGTSQEDPLVIQDRKRRKLRNRMSEFKVLTINEDGKFPCYKCKEVFSCPVILKTHYIICLKLTLQEKKMLEKEMFKEMRKKMRTIEDELKHIKKVHKIKKREKWLKKQEKKLQEEKRLVMGESSILKKGKAKKKIEGGKKQAKTKGKNTTEKNKSLALEEEKQKNTKHNKTTQTVSSGEKFTDAEVLNAVHEALMKDVGSSLIGMYSQDSDKSNLAGEVNQPESNFSIEDVREIEENCLDQTAMSADKAIHSPGSKQ